MQLSKVASNAQRCGLRFLLSAVASDDEIRSQLTPATARDESGDDSYDDSFEEDTSDDESMCTVTVMFSGVGQAEEATSTKLKAMKTLVSFRVWECTASPDNGRFELSKRVFEPDSVHQLNSPEFQSPEIKVGGTYLVSLLAQADGATSSEDLARGVTVLVQAMSTTHRVTLTPVPCDASPEGDDSNSSSNEPSRTLEAVSRGTTLLPPEDRSPSLPMFLQCATQQTATVSEDVTVQLRHWVSTLGSAAESQDKLDEELRRRDAEICQLRNQLRQVESRLRSSAAELQQPQPPSSRPGHTRPQLATGRSYHTASDAPRGPGQPALHGSVKLGPDSSNVDTTHTPKRRAGSASVVTAARVPAANAADLAGTLHGKLPASPSTSLGLVGVQAGAGVEQVRPARRRASLRPLSASPPPEVQPPPSEAVVVSPGEVVAVSGAPTAPSWRSSGRHRVSLAPLKASPKTTASANTTANVEPTAIASTSPPSRVASAPSARAIPGQAPPAGTYDGSPLSETSGSTSTSTGWGEARASSSSPAAAGVTPPSRISVQLLGLAKSADESTSALPAP